MASPTPNKGYTYPAHGGAVGAWDTPLNTNFDQIDLNVGGAYPITVTSTATTVTYNSSGAIVSSTAVSVTIPTTLAQNMFYNVTGTLTQNLSVNMSSAGGLYVFGNNSSGSFTVTVQPNTGTGVTLKQGGQQVVVTNSSVAFIANNAAGNVVYDSITVSSGVTVQSVTASSAISAQSVAASSAITAQSVTASSALSGAIAQGTMIASSATQVTGTSTNTLVTPAQQQNHTSAAKAWGDIFGATGTLIQGYNVSATSRTGTGVYTVTFTANMANNTYPVMATTFGGGNLFAYLTARSTNGFTVKVVSDGATASDPTHVSFVCFGPLA